MTNQGILFRWGGCKWQTSLKWLTVTLIIVLAGSAFGQDAEWKPRPDDGKGKRLVFRAINLIGNKRTRSRIILRELEIYPGANIKLADSANFFVYETNKVFNTKLFNFVQVHTTQYQAIADSSIPDTATLTVQVHERWYFFPLPVLELADRSFSEWLYNRGGKFDRINYGVRFVQQNLFGNNDPLNLTFQQGFTQSYELGYSTVLGNKGLNTSLGIQAGYYTNKSVAIMTRDNKQVFYASDSEKVGRTRFYTSVGVNLRQGFFASHSVSLSYNTNTLPELYVQQNPDYFLNGRTWQQYTTLSYFYTYDYRNIRFYPTRGWYLNLDLDLTGISPFDSYRQYSIGVAAAKFFELGQNFYLGHRIETIAALPTEQSYFNATGMRFGRYGIRGYELYLAEGPFVAISRNSLRYKVYSRVFNFERNVKARQINKFPLTIYLKSFYDFGIILNQNPKMGNAYMANRLLNGGGIGLDIATLYDLIFRFEYSINQLDGKPRLIFGTSFDL